MILPPEFIDETRPLFGEERWARYVAAFDEPAPVSVRLNPFKVKELKDERMKDLPTDTDSPANSLILTSFNSLISDDVPWCHAAYWLRERPQFTLDPLLHAGAYYVQEAGSMFLDCVLRQLVTKPVTMLDLCAAPGGKSTLARAALPEGSMLWTNEPDRRRANILVENMQKQGHPDVCVTSCHAADYARSGMMFDVVLCDVPCSGEGLFRRDPSATGEWSLSSVSRCAELQRSIVSDIYPCLRPGGLLVYSTCTFNRHEDEDNVRYIIEELGAEPVEIDTKPEWHISGSLVDDFSAPVYRFIPGTTRSEGLFMAVLRKNADGNHSCGPNGKRGSLPRLLHPADTHNVATHRGASAVITDRPTHAEALAINRGKEYLEVELSLQQALSYLRREAITLPDTVPRGFVIVTYQGFALGFVKNIGSRANNLYPKEWAIKYK